MLFGFPLAVGEVAVDRNSLPGKTVVVNDQFCVCRVYPVGCGDERVDLGKNGIFFAKNMVETVDCLLDIGRRIPAELTQEKPRHIGKDRAEADRPDGTFRTLCGLLDVHSPGLGKEDDRLLFCPVDRDAHEILVLDIEALFDKDPLDRDTLDRCVEEFSCRLHDRVAVCHENAAGFSPASDIHLSFHRNLCRHLVHVEEDLLVLAHKDALWHPDSLFSKKLLCLVLQ